MTTRVFVMNFGPDEVDVERPGTPKVHLYPLQYGEYYVYDEQTVTVREQKPVPPEVKDGK